MNPKPRGVFAAFCVLALAALACVFGPAATPPGGQPATSLPPSSNNASLEPEQNEVWMRASGAGDNQVYATTTAGAGDSIWTRASGRALLKWTDFKILLYHDTESRILQCPDTGGICTQLQRGVGLADAGPQAANHYREIDTENGKAVVLGTRYMVAYDPNTRFTLVRVFDGRVRVTGAATGETATAGPREWVLIAGANAPEVSARLDDMRAVARRMGMWDRFHHAELDAQKGFGGAAGENVDIVFLECRVTAGTLNLRAGPGTGFTAIAKLPGGALLQPLGRDPGSEWIRVRSERDGMEGWVNGNAKYVACNITPADLAPVEPPEAPPPAATITPTPPPREVRLVCGPAESEVQVGECAQLSWSAENATEVRFDNDLVDPSGSIGLCPNATGTWKHVITATGPGGAAACAMRLTAVQPGPLEIEVIEETPVGEVHGDGPSSQPLCGVDSVLIRARVAGANADTRAAIEWTSFIEWTDYAGPKEMEREGSSDVFRAVIPAAYYRIHAEDAQGRAADFRRRGRPCTVVVFDFIAHADEAEWSGSQGALPFDGSDGDERGFVKWRRGYALEDGSRPELFLETHPTWVDRGRIEGIYRSYGSYPIETGMRLQVEVGLMEGAGVGDATLYVSFLPGCSLSNEFPPLIFSARETYDGRLGSDSASLAEATGPGCFRVSVNAGESSAQDWMAWTRLRIVR